MNRSLKIENETAYRTDDLRAFIRAGLEAAGASLDKRVTVVPVAGRRGSTWSSRGEVKESFVVDDLGVGTRYDSREGNRWKLGINRKDPTRGGWGAPLAALVWREAKHSLGVAYTDMDRETRMCSGSHPWAEGLVIRRRAEVAKPKPKGVERDAKRLDHARAMVARSARRVKRLTTLLKKWEAKVTYYERKAAPKPEPEKPAPKRAQPEGLARALRVRMTLRAHETAHRAYALADSTYPDGHEKLREAHDALKRAAREHADAVESDRQHRAAREHAREKGVK